MNDEVDIRSGGFVAVDTDTLRNAAARLSTVAGELDALAARLWVLSGQSARAGLLEPSPAGGVERARDRAEALTRALRDRAELYEVVERSVTLGWDSPAARIALLGVDPAVVARAHRLVTQWYDERHREVEDQLRGALAPVVPMTLLIGRLIQGITVVDHGVVGRSDPLLRGTPPATVVTELARRQVEPPRALADLAARVPGPGESRVRVEVYTSAGPAPAHEYVVYIAGMQSFGDGADPWDMQSNLELYEGRASSSSDAVERALAAAGARPGDRVHYVGHSQGAMIASQLARESEFDVGSLVTFASPVAVHLPPDVLQVTVRHPDDPVVALADGGWPSAAGSAQSLVIERIADPEPRLTDLALGVHQMDVYRETAALADASGDPRLADLQRELFTFGGATAGVAIVYGAERDRARLPSPRPGPSPQPPTPPR